MEEFAKGRPVQDLGEKGRAESGERRPLILHQIFVTVEYPDQ